MKRNRAEISRNVTVYWDVMSGEPCVKGRRIPTHVPTSYFVIGKSVAEIAAIFRLTVRQVEDAIRFEYQLSLRRQKRPIASKPSKPLPKETP
jgi:uncharacterized protein (DUF433 family)